MVQKKGNIRSKRNRSDLKIMIIGTLFACLLTIGCGCLTAKYIGEYSASKSYASATATVEGEVQKNRVTSKDNTGKITSDHTYYWYQYAFEVDGQKYTGEKNNVEDYYGDSFEVLYDRDDPATFVIAQEAKFPIGMCIATLFLAVIAGACIFQTIRG